VPLFTVRVEATPELPDDTARELHRLIGVGVRAAVDALARDLPPEVRWSYLVQRGVAVEQPAAPDSMPHPFMNVQPPGPTCLLFVGPSRVCGMPRVHPVHDTTTTTGGGT